MRSLARLEQRRGAAWLAALLLCAGFLGLTLLLVPVGYESNDDLTLAAFVDGQMAQRTAHIPYLNIALGALLKLVYGVLGRGAVWQLYGQYLLMLLGFAALGAVFNRRLGIPGGSLALLMLLLFFGVDAFTRVNYTKTAAVCTVGGTLLVLRAAESDASRAEKSAGVALALFGFLLRAAEFLPCFGITAALALGWLVRLLRERPGAKEGLRRLLRYAAPFACVLLLAGLFHAVNEAAWAGEPWAGYHRFDAIRVAYSDYGRPAYEEMPDAYDALGLSETDVRMLYEGNYFDPEVFSADVMEAVSRARDARFPRPSAGELLGLFLDRAIPGFFVNLPVYGLLLMLALWLCAGRHETEDWLALLASAGLGGLSYLYLIWRGRYLIDRVDLGLLLALAAGLGFLLDRERLKSERALAALLLALALSVSWFLNRPQEREREDFSAGRAAVERLMADTEHVYLAKLDTVSDRIYSPFEPWAPGYWDRIVLLGGFDCLHPTVMANLARYGVANPYRDCIDNDRVYLIEDDVELTLRYLREHYEPEAEAVPVEPLSAETGLRIYRIVKGGAA